MKPSSQSPRTPSRLSESLQRHLNAYARAASAAGVSLLALAQPAEAKIVYTKTHHVIGENEKYPLAINNETVDFIIANKLCLGSKTGCESWAYAKLSVYRGSRGKSGNEVAGVQPWVSALKPGARISKGQVFVPGGDMVWQFQVSYGSSRCFSAPCTSGDWVNVSNRYLGLKFKIDGKFHYGWARFNVTVGKFEIAASLTGYAYETIPNKPIIAGKTKGPDVITLEPGSLGRLAQGSAGRLGR